MRELNATACAALYERVEWSSPWNLITLIVLAIVNVMVVLGNVLVILAVYHTNKLRNVTNMFIVSLAVADLMVGLAVLPFSATWEVFKTPPTTPSPRSRLTTPHCQFCRNNASEAYRGGDAFQTAEVHASRQVSQDHLVGRHRSRRSLKTNAD